MKVFDIISEAPEYTTPGGIVIPSGSKTAGPAPSTTTPKPSSGAKWTGTQSNYRKIARDPGLTGKGLFAWITSSYDKFGKNQTRTDRVIAAQNAKWGKFFTFLYVIGITVSAYELYCKLDFAQERIGKPVEEGGLTKEEYTEYEEFQWGIFTLQVLTPVVLRIIRSVLFINWILRIIKWIAGGLSVGVTAGGSVALLVATEAFQLWFQYFLGSAKGQDWLINHGLGPLIRTGGIPATWVSHLIKEWRDSGKDKESEKDGTGDGKTDSGASGQKADDKNKDKESDIYKTDKTPDTVAPKTTDNTVANKVTKTDTPNVVVTKDPKGKFDVEMGRRYN